jgi:WD40 repeat protein
VFGGRIQPLLVNQLLNDMGADPDQLPVMQHLLMRMWQHRGVEPGASFELTLEDYKAVGGFAQALSRHADEAFGSLKGAEQKRLAEILLRCATERLIDKQDSRRPVRIREVAAVAGVPWQRVAEVVEAFRRSGNSFLLPPETVPLDEDTIVDITHESLIRQWNRLSEWVRDEALRAERYRKIWDAAQDWVKHAKARSWLLRSPELDDALVWRSEARPTVAWAARYGGDFELVRDFLDRSIRRRALMRGLTWSTIGLALLLLAGGVLRYQRYLREKAVAAQRQAAAEERAKLEKENIALAYDLAGQANLIRGLKVGLLETSTLLAVEAANRFPSLQVNQALRESLRLLPARASIQPGSHASYINFASDGRLLVGDRGWLNSIDPSNGQESVAWKCETCASVKLLATSSNGRYLAAAIDRQVVVIDQQTGTQITQPIAYTSGDVFAVSADGRLSAIQGRTARQINPSEVRHASPGLRLAPSAVGALSPDARNVAIWNPSAGRVEVQSLENGKPLFGWTLGPAAEVTQLAFSPDGEYLAAAPPEGVVRIWSLARGSEARRVPLANPRSLRGLYVGWDAGFVVAFDREAMQVFDLRESGTPREVTRIEGFGIPTQIATSPDGQFLAASGRSGVRLWQLSTGGEVARFVTEQAVSAVAMSADRKLVAAASPIDDPQSSASEVAVWSVDSGRKLYVQKVTGAVSNIHFSADASGLLIGGGDGALVHVIPQPGVQLAARRPSARVGANTDAPQYGARADSMPLDCGSDSRVAGFSGDGRRVAVESGHGDVCIFDTGDGSLAARFTAARGPVSLSQSGDSVALLGLDRRVRWANLSSAAERRTSAGESAAAVQALDAASLTPLLVAPAKANELVLSPKASYLALSTLKRGVHVRAAMSDRPVPRVAHDSSIDAIAFNSDETLLATGGRDSSARVWDITADGQAAKEVARVAHQGPVTALTFSDDDQYLVTASDRVVRVLQWKTEDLARAACSRVSRNLSRDEWGQYFQGKDYVATCNGLSGDDATGDANEPLERAGERLVQGQVQEALALYQLADGTSAVSARDWNSLCWNGSLWGFAEDVLFACDKAVQAEPQNPSYRDSRGLAEALAGQSAAGVADLRFAVGASGGLNQEQRKQRRHWIAALERGDDPFTIEEIRAMRD